MKLLLVYPYIPYPLDRGTYHRVFNLARELGRRHEVDLFCLDEEGADTPEARAVFAEFTRRFEVVPFQHPPWPRLFPDRLLNMTPTTVAHWTNSSVAAALRKFTDGQFYDLVHFCDLVMWQYVSQIPQVNSTYPYHGTDSPLRVMDRSRVDLLFQTEEFNNLKLSGKEKFLRQENLWKLRRYERKVAALLDATVVCGPDDKTFLNANVPEAREIKVLANGVDEAFFRREDFPPTPDPEPTILFCGAMDYSPNVNGLAWYFQHADALVREKLPQRKVLIVGKNPLDSVKAHGAVPGVTVTGGVPDVRPYYQHAWVQMVPLLIGGGTRLKIVESLALGTPVVSTTIGAQGLVLEDGTHLLLGDSPQDFAAALVRILGDDALRARVSEAGRERVLERYTWGQLGAELSAYYEELVK